MNIKDWKLEKNFKFKCGPEYFITISKDEVIEVLCVKSEKVYFRLNNKVYSSDKNNYNNDLLEKFFCDE